MTCPNPFSIRLDRSGIVCVTWMPGTKITGEMARGVVEAVAALNADRSRALAVEMGGTAHLDREAREQFSKIRLVTKIALIGKSRVDRVLGNFRLGMELEGVPVDYFTNYETAVTG